MPRPKKKRTINFFPSATYFKPAGIPLRELDEVVIAHEELEALRLQVLLEKNQEGAAQQMSISQPTFHRLINTARKKIVDALVNGKAIKIKGGNYIMKEKGIASTNKIIIAISSSSKDLEGDIDSRFGRCQYFILVSIDNGDIVSFESIENVKSDMRGGVGIAVAKMLADHNINGIISGNIGPRAIDVLKQFEIPVYQADGSKREIIQDFIAGKCNLI
jgi:predicted DNA-binding protein (UPF0251 family)/predicted Fe-Mo cluster-binding NifX family protein